MWRTALIVGFIGCKGKPPTEPTPTPPPSATGLAINEVMAANDSAVRDPDNPTCAEFDDWIELVNAGDEAVQTAGIELRDGSGSSLVLPGRTLAPGAHLLVWADDQPEQGPLHAPFAVSASGETLELVRGSEVLDSVEVPEIGRDHSWARLRDGSGEWLEVSAPTPGRSNHRVLPDDPCFAPPVGFDDHSYPCIPDEAGYTALSGDRTALRIVKFDIFDFQTSPRIRYVDSEFYTLHDQYYLFTVFNGQVFDGLDLYPPYPGEFRTWSELDNWARTVSLDTLVNPTQARFAGDRLYSPYYYASVNGTPRSLGVGTVVHRSADEPGGEVWAFELEYADPISYDDLVVYFEALAASGPPDFAQIRWLIRSPEQEALAQQMESEGLPYADRLMRYDELTVPGDVEVYNPGLTAGRVVRIRAGEGGLDSTLPTDILVLEEIPDFLPPCAALITSVPQTPLSHVSLLARSRGIPNLYVAGISTDPEWDAWTRVQTRIALQATASGEVNAGAMSFSAYLQWRQLGQGTLPELEPVDPTNLPWSWDLATAPDPLTLRPLAGGKVAGLRALLDVPDLDAPDTPLGLSIRSYHAHLDAFPWLEALLDAPPFTAPNTARERFLVLEGRAAYDERFLTPEDAIAADTFLAGHPPGDRAGDLARADGLVGTVANTPMPVDVRTALVDAVAAQFAWTPPGTGLRFRSSSTVEDVEGFNGAGLYISATGALEPDVDQRSVEEAIRAVWASYWGAEAFEEREGAGLEHLDGGMGVLVHPRFADDFELANAVLTASILPDGSHEVLVNAQAGAISVANPPTTCPPVLPETVRMRDAEGSVVIERIGRSTEVPVGTPVLPDPELLALFDQTVAATESWLAFENAALEPALRRSVLTLDLESRWMDVGWLGSTTSRLITKQARSLEPSAGTLPEDVQELAAPRDLLARAASVDEVRCTEARFRVSLASLTTDPLAVPDLGYSDTPFVVQVELLPYVNLPELGLSAGQSKVVSHLDLSDVVLGVSSFSASSPGLDVAIEPGGAFVITGDSGSVQGTASCTAQTLWASPDGFLLDYL